MVKVDDGMCGLLALIAATVSHLHMHLPVALHGQLGGVAALTRLWMDGMIAAASPISCAIPSARSWICLVTKTHIPTYPCLLAAGHR